MFPFHTRDSLNIHIKIFKVQNADWHSAFGVKEETGWTVCVNVEACESKWKVFLCCYRLHTERPVCVVRRILTQHGCVNSRLFQLLDKCEPSRQLCPGWYLNWALLYLQQRDVCMWPGLPPIFVPTGLPFFCSTCTFGCTGVAIVDMATFSYIALVLLKLLRLLVRFRFFLRHRAHIGLSSIQKWPDWAASYCWLCRRKLLKMLTLLCFALGMYVAV